MKRTSRSPIDAFVQRETHKLRRVCVNEISLTIFVSSSAARDIGKVAFSFLPEAALDTVPNISYKGENLCSYTAVVLKLGHVYTRGYARGCLGGIRRVD